MHSQLNQIMIQEHIADLRRVADRERLAASVRPTRGHVHLRPVGRVVAVFARVAAARA